jgi:hypothetical protein
MDNHVKVYSQIPDEQLLSLAEEQSTLTEGERRVLLAELQSRGGEAAVRARVEESTQVQPSEAPSSRQPVEDERELRAFVGDEADYYLAAWFKGGRASFNWAAFLFSAPWLFYRKMYRVAALFLAIGIALTFVLPELVVTFGLALLCGFYGNWLYYRRARGVVRKVRATEPLEENRVKLLARRGGTSPIAVLVLLLVVVLGPLFAGQLD